MAKGLQQMADLILKSNLHYPTFSKDCKYLIIFDKSLVLRMNKVLSKDISFLGMLDMLGYDAIFILLAQFILMNSLSSLQQSVS